MHATKRAHCVRLTLHDAQSVVYKHEIRDSLNETRFKTDGMRGGVALRFTEETSLGRNDSPIDVESISIDIDRQTISHWGATCATRAAEFAYSFTTDTWRQTSLTPHARIFPVKICVQVSKRVSGLLVLLLG